MKKVLLLIIISFLISSCEYFTLMSKKEWEEKAGKEDDVIIYAAGIYDDGTNYIPCYWKIKDGKIKRFDLDHESNNNNTANSIYVLGDTVYTAGNVELDSGQRKPCYWINTKRYDLYTSPLILNGFATSINVISGVVFTTGNDGTDACYWINKNQNLINISNAQSIFIDQISSSKYTTYIGGQNLKTPRQACYWKDGSIIDLSPLPTIAGESSSVFTIKVIGNIVYTVGKVTLDIPPMTEFAYLWINDKPTILPNGTSAYNLYVINDDIYVTGLNSSSQACYWKNEKYFPLSSSASVAFGVYGYNDKVYVSGYELGFACYWINDNHYSLEDSVNSLAYAIFVKSNNE